MNRPVVVRGKVEERNKNHTKESERGIKTYETERSMVKYGIRTGLRIIACFGNSATLPLASLSRVFPEALKNSSDIPCDGDVDISDPQACFVHGNTQTNGDC